jgi:hypothetical protein
LYTGSLRAGRHIHHQIVLLEREQRQKENQKPLHPRQNKGDVIGKPPIVKNDLISYVVTPADLLEAYSDEYTERRETTYKETTMADTFFKHPNGQPFARIYIRTPSGGSF